MKLARCIMILAFGLASGVVCQTHAGDKNKSAQQQIDPAERIEKLLQTLKSERKEDLRVKAAEELGKSATSEFPEIVSALIDALVRDTSTSVRKAVIHSLAEIEPATHEVKDALDQAVKQDKAWTVRQAARIALWRYKPKDEPPTVPGPKLRNTSKPTSTGKVPPGKTTPKPAEPVDPLKSLPIPIPPVPVIPADAAPPAPVMASGPGIMTGNDPVPTTARGEPARLTAPKPSGK